MTSRQVDERVRVGRNPATTGAAASERSMNAVPWMGAVLMRYLYQVPLGSASSVTART